MERRALLTGSFSQRGDVARALKEAGFSVTESDGAESGGPCPHLDPSSVDSYVQLPVDRHARRMLLNLLAQAVRADHGGAVRAVVIGEEGCSPEEIAQVALRQGWEQGRRISEYAAHGAELSFTDWQREVLSLASGEEQPPRTGGAGWFR